MPKKAPTGVMMEKRVEKHGLLGKIHRTAHSVCMPVSARALQPV